MSVTRKRASGRYRWRLSLALALAPLPVPVIVAAAVLLLPGVPFTRVSPQPAAVRLFEAVFLGLAALPVAYGAEIFLAVPVYFRYLRPRGALRLRLSLVLGAAVGAAPPVVVAASILVWQLSPSDLHVAAVLYLSGIGAVCGMVSAAIFRKLVALTPPRPE